MSSIMKKLSKIFIKGLLYFLPFALSVYVFVAIFRTIELGVERIVLVFFPPTWYFPGLGILLTLLTIFFMGLIVYFSFAHQLQEWMEYPFKKIPGLKTIYSIFVELISYFSKGSDGGSGRKVVLIKHPEYDVDVVGLVTQEDHKSLPPGIRQGKIAVYLPLSYQMGGLTVFVDRSMVREIDLPFESALKGAISGWVLEHKHNDNSSKKEVADE